MARTSCLFLFCCCALDLVAVFKISFLFFYCFFKLVEWARRRDHLLIELLVLSVGCVFFFSIQSGFFECGRKLDSFFTITDFFCKLFSSFRARYRVASLCMLIVKRFFLV